MCPSGVTRVTVDCWFSELGLKITFKRVGLQYHLIDMYLVLAMILLKTC